MNALSGILYLMAFIFFIITAACLTLASTGVVIAMSVITGGCALVGYLASLSANDKEK